MNDMTGGIGGTGNMVIIKRIFCKDCKYLRWEGHSYSCKRPGNVIHKVTDSWLQTTVTQKYDKDPNVLNQNNDCKWYEEKPEEKKSWFSKAQEWIEDFWNIYW